ncbi:hypothetical protein [Paenibacillus sp. MMO-177]|uniref:hypothetical protein n=1 Tax=Paenibacillus sp. MMO-177 TaxID=3081289 RepID=UPI0030199B08
MKLKVFKSAWEMQGSAESVLKKIAEAGYDGIEVWHGSIGEKNEFKRLLRKYKLDLIVGLAAGKKGIEMFLWNSCCWTNLGEERCMLLGPQLGLREIPERKFTADFSRWFCVCESVVARDCS